MLFKRLNEDRIRKSQIKPLINKPFNLCIDMEAKAMNIAKQGTMQKVRSSANISTPIQKPNKRGSPAKTS